MFLVEFLQKITSDKLIKVFIFRPISIWTYKMFLHKQHYQVLHQKRKRVNRDDSSEEVKENIFNPYPTPQKEKAEKYSEVTQVCSLLKALVQ